MTYNLNAKNIHVSYPIFRLDFNTPKPAKTNDADNDNGEQASFFIFVRKQVSIFENACLAVPVITIEQYLKSERKNLSDDTLKTTYRGIFPDLHFRKSLFSDSAVQDLYINYEDAEFFDMDNEIRNGLTFSKVGEIHQKDFGFVNAKINQLLDTADFLGNKAYERFLSRAYEYLKTGIADNKLWGSIQKNSLATPQRQVSEELQDFEETRKLAESIMNKGVPLSDAIDIARFGSAAKKAESQTFNFDVNKVYSDQNIPDTQQDEDEFEAKIVDTVIQSNSSTEPTPGETENITETTADAEIINQTVIEKGPVEAPIEEITSSQSELAAQKSADIKDMSIAEAISRELLFEDEKGFNAAAFLSRPCDPDAPKTIMEAYKIVMHDREGLTGLFKSTGPAVSRRLADRIEKIAYSLSKNIIFDISFQDAVDSGLFDQSGNEIINYRALLKKPLKNDERSMTLKDVYERASTDPASFAGRYQGVGPTTSRRISDKVIKVVKSKILGADPSP